MIRSAWLETNYGAVMFVPLPSCELLRSPGRNNYSLGRGAICMGWCKGRALHHASAGAPRQIMVFHAIVNMSGCSTALLAGWLTYVTPNLQHLCLYGHIFVYKGVFTNSHHSMMYWHRILTTKYSKFPCSKVCLWWLIFSLWCNLNNLEADITTLTFTWSRPYTMLPLTINYLLSFVNWAKQTEHGKDLLFCVPITLKRKHLVALLMKEKYAFDAWNKRSDNINLLVVLLAQLKTFNRCSDADDGGLAVDDVDVANFANQKKVLIRKQCLDYTW